jgi:hypothetical protein
MATRHPLVLNGGQIEQLQDGDSVPAADKLAAARTISLSGDAAGSASFDGSGNVSIATTVADDSHNHVIGNVDGLQSALDGKAASSHTHSYAPVSHTHGGGDITSAVANATKLATARTISLTGGVTGSASFDGSANASIAATVADDSHSHDTKYYKKAEAVPSGADLNDYTVPGFYYCSLNATASTMSNIPVPCAFSLRVYLSAGVTQHWQGYNTSDVYVRSYYSTSGWTAWSKLSLDGHTHSGLTTSAWARVQTYSGYIDFGPANTSWAHIYTDRPSFYFNKPLVVLGDGVVLDTLALTAGNGLTGGGDLSANRTISLGTPGSCSPSTSNAATSTSHTHAITGVAESSHTHSYAPIPTSSALPVGTLAFLGLTITTADVANNGTTSGSNLKPIGVCRIADGSLSMLLGVAQAGTWKNISGSTVYRMSGTGSLNTGLFVRTA